YDVRFHPEVVFDQSVDVLAPIQYEEKLEFRSPHSVVCRDEKLVPPNSEVLDIGCSTGYVAEELQKRRNCRVTGIDILPLHRVRAQLLRYLQIDLSQDDHRLVALLKESRFDVILMLDVVEHLSHPEKFLLRLSSLQYAKVPRFVFSTGNVGFIIVRMMLMLGHFNYGDRGILDVTHKRLFSMHTFRGLLEQTGYLIQREIYIPFP